MEIEGVRLTALVRIARRGESPQSIAALVKSVGSWDVFWKPRPEDVEVIMVGEAEGDRVILLSRRKTRTESLEEVTDALWVLARMEI